MQSVIAGILACEPLVSELLTLLALTDPGKLEAALLSVGVKLTAYWKGPFSTWEEASRTSARTP